MGFSPRAAFKPKLTPCTHRLAACAPYANSVIRRLHSHLGHLKFFVVDANQGAAADASFTDSREENPAVRVQNICLWIGKNGLLLWLYTEETGVPPSGRGETNFFRPVWQGQLKAEGTVVRRGHTIGYVECTITDEENRLVAKAASTCMVLRGQNAAGR